MASGKLGPCPCGTVEPKEIHGVPGDSGGGGGIRKLTCFGMFCYVLKCFGMFCIILNIMTPCPPLADDHRIRSDAMERHLQEVPLCNSAPWGGRSRPAEPVEQRPPERGITTRYHDKVLRQGIIYYDKVLRQGIMTRYYDRWRAGGEVSKTKNTKKNKT